MILKYNSSGRLLFNATLGGSATDQGETIYVKNNFIYVAGTTYSYGVGGRDAWTLKMDLSANPIWNKTVGNASDDFAYGITVNDHEEVYVTGNIYLDGNYDAIISNYHEYGDT